MEILCSAYWEEGCILNDLMENDAFIKGLLFGVSLYQAIVITAHKRKEGLKIGENLYYFQDGRERLEEFLEKICR